MLGWQQRIVTIISAVVLAVIGELAAKYITGSFEALRGTAMLAAALGLAVLLLAMLSKNPRKRIIIDFISLTTGLIAITIGVALSMPGNLSQAEQLWIVKTCLIALGMLESILAAYSLYIGLSGREIDFLPLLNLGDRRPNIVSEHGRNVAITQLAELRPEHKAIMEKLRAQVAVEDLHYVAYYVNSNCLFFVDVLDHAELDRFFQDTERQIRRAQYERHGRQIIWLVSALDRSFRRIQGGMLIRTVLDVQHGAVYHYPIAVGVDLVGVTLIQEQVAQADEKLTAIRDELADLPRGGKLGARPLEDSPYYLPAPGNPADVLPLAPRQDRSAARIQSRRLRSL